MFVGIVIISTLARFDFIYVKHDFLIELKREKPICEYKFTVFLD